MYDRRELGEFHGDIYCRNLNGRYLLEDTRCRLLENIKRWAVFVCLRTDSYG
jgi:hypothetical protein